MSILNKYPWATETNKLLLDNCSRNEIYQSLLKESKDKGIPLAPYNTDISNRHAALITAYEAVPVEHVVLSTTPAPKEGPGTELTKLISWFIFSKKCTQCIRRKQQMNRWGPDKCLENIDTIKRWLKHSAAKKKVPYSDKLVTILISKAIRNAR